MQVPKGVNYLEFWLAAKQKNVKVHSQFIGVSVTVNHGSPAWAARYQSNGKVMLFKRFPFTEDGEVQARNCFNHFVEKNNIQLRYKVKRKRKPVKKASDEK